MIYGDSLDCFLPVSKIPNQDQSELLWLKFKSLFEQVLTVVKSEMTSTVYNFHKNTLTKLFKESTKQG